MQVGSSRLQALSSRRGNNPGTMLRRSGDAEVRNFDASAQYYYPSTRCLYT